MAESFLTLQHKPWKVWMDSSPSNPSATLVCLYDLLFDSSGATLYNSTFASTTGINIGHDIILYDSSVYTANGEPYKTAAKFSLWQQNAIDIGLVKYDTRNKPYAVDATELSASSLGAPFSTTSWKAYLHDKDAAEFPVNVVAGIYYNDSYSQNYRGSALAGTDFTTYGTLTSVGRADDSSTQDAAVILSNPDTVFKASMVLEDGKYAYTKVCLNPHSDFVKEFVIAAVAETLGASINKGYTAVSNDSIASFSLVSFAQISCVTTILKNLYVWIKAPFAADYIDPEDFNQDLNQDSDVIHHNILVSETTGDYNRYADSTSSDSEYATVSTRPYIPKNAPLRDFVSDKYTTLKTTDIAATIKSLIEDADKPNSLIGAVLSEPVAITEASNTTGTSVSPLTYFDPESRMLPEDYVSKPGRIPTIMPKGGNIVTDGRVVSPTIDEIWYIVKKLISGRELDSVAASATLSDTSYDKALPVSTVEAYKNTADTTLKEVVSSQYKFDVSVDGTSTLKVGDPVNFSITDDASGAASIAVTEFFTQPQSVRYHIYNLISEYSKLATTFETKDDDNYNGVTYARDNDSRTVEDFAKAKTVENDTTSDAELWAPRASAPLSLRELEAAILGNKYNILNNFLFLVNNFAVTGGLGKEETEDYTDSDGKAKTQIISGGSLYQLHRDYNYNTKAPNTFFHENGTGASVSDSSTGAVAGMDASFGDIANKVVDEAQLYLLDGKTQKRTTTLKVSKMPLLAVNYGRSTLVSKEQGGYTGADVYLAADGTWRYIAEHVRVPILRERY